METTLQTQLAVARQQLIDLCQCSIWSRLKIVFDHHPDLLFFHFAKHGEDRRFRHLAINGIRWEEIEFFIHAYDFERTRADANPDLVPAIQKHMAIWPNFKSLRLAAEETFLALSDLSGEGIFSMMGSPLFRLIVTKEGIVSYHPLTREEAAEYPEPPPSRRN